MSESDDPYSDTHTSVDCPTGLVPQGIITSGWFIPNTDQELIKNILMDYGAMATNMYYTGSSFNSIDNTYYYSGSSGTNHAVTLVGWDDTKVTAGGTGVWIIKNSWGPGWGEDGYFYVAYQDTKINTTLVLFRDYIDYNPDHTVSTYSESGRVASLGYGSTQADALCKFTASENIQLTRVGTWTTYPGAVLNIEIYDAFDGTSTLTGLLGSVLNETCTYSGYHSFVLPASIFISEGNDYYIKVNYLTTGYNYPIPVETAFSGYNTPVFETGKCWTKSAAGIYWNSADGDRIDLCIYAYTTAICYFAQWW
jgi:hypothetical protein